MILDEKLSPGHARAILQVEGQFHEDFANLIIRNNLSVRKAEMEAKRIKESGLFAKPKVEMHVIPELAEHEKILKKRYKIKVKITDKNNKGKITFYYSEKTELDKLLNQLENE